jgi:hypothetical protein
MNAIPWPETYLPPRKGAKHKTLHVTESVFWTKKEKIAHRLLSPHGWVVGRINSRKKNTGAWEGKYPGDGHFTKHKLKIEDYGIDKNWGFVKYLGDKGPDGPTGVENSVRGNGSGVSCGVVIDTEEFWRRQQWWWDSATQWDLPKEVLMRVTQFEVAKVIKDNVVVSKRDLLHVLLEVVVGKGEMLLML